MLQNGWGSPLTAGQIAAHLHTRIWNVTRDLQIGRADRAAGRPTRRMPGEKVRGEGVGSGGQWRIDRQAYLTWLQIPVEDRDHLGPDGLPELVPFELAAEQLSISELKLQELVQRGRHPHIAFGRKRYLTHNQLDRLRGQLAEDLREATPGGNSSDAPVTSGIPVSPRGPRS